MENKYIDAEKLKAEIERLLKCTEQHRGEAVADGSRQTLYWIENFIGSLQQEQPDVVLDNRTIMEEIRKCGCNPNEFDVARHFYELGKARKEV